MPSPRQPPVDRTFTQKFPATAAPAAGKIHETRFWRERNHVPTRTFFAAKYPMPALRLTVISHFRNEEVYLPFWLRHHTRLFDHGVMIDYRSSDRSVEIVRELAPTWEIRPSRNEKFHSASIDREVMDIETEFSGWKMCLNVTEFLSHDELRKF